MTKPHALRTPLLRASLATLFLSAAFALAGCGDEDLAPRSASPLQNDGAVDDRAVDDLGEGPASPGAEEEEEDEALPPDPCEAVETACPTETAREGRGVVPIDRCAFPVEHAKGAPDALLAAIEKRARRVTLADVLADLNRVGFATTRIPGSPPGVAYGFRWASVDENSAVWIPQGISGSADATANGLYGGKRVVLVSSYHKPAAEGDPRKGSRISVMDATGDTRNYRVVMLVAPSGTPEAPSLAPVNVHAGGIVWIGNYLYVVDTTKGFRVFDLTRILKVSADRDAFECDGTRCYAGTYGYAIPQVASYTTRSKCAPLHSFVALDRSTDPPALVSGEYCSGTACSGPLAGRIFRWPVNAKTGLLRSGVSYPESAYLMGHRQVQGGVTYKGTFYLSSSKPAGVGGELYRVSATGSSTSRWVDTPEDIMIDPTTGLIHGLAEFGTRAVFGARLASYPPP